jgi:hypothetical protein
MKVKPPRWFQVWLVSDDDGGNEPLSFPSGTRGAGHGTHVETRFPAARKIGNNARRAEEQLFSPVKPPPAERGSRINASSGRARGEKNQGEVSWCE